MNSKGIGRKRPVVLLKYQTGNFVEGLSKTAIKASVRIYYM